MFWSTLMIELILKQCRKISEKNLIIVPAYDRDWKVPLKSSWCRMAKKFRQD